MTERGPPSAPVLPNEPQREITGSIVARHRSLALIRPNKPVSSQGGTHPFPPPGQDPASSTLHQSGHPPPHTHTPRPHPCHRDHRGDAVLSQSQPLSVPDAALLIYTGIRRFFFYSPLFFLVGVEEGGALYTMVDIMYGYASARSGCLLYLPALLPPF